MRGQTGVKFVRLYPMNNQLSDLPSPSCIAIVVQQVQFKALLLRSTKWYIVSYRKLIENMIFCLLKYLYLTFKLDTKKINLRLVN